MKKIRFIVLLVLLIGIFSACHKVQYTITFDSNGGSSVSTVGTDGKSSIKMPNNPTRENYIFDGWYYDNHFFRKPFAHNSLIDNPIGDNLTVYAKWSKKLIATAGLEFQFQEDSFTVTGYSGTDKDIVIADMHNGYPVKKIAPTAFENKNITTVVISNSICEIGAGAFKGCKNIEEMTLPFIGKNRGSNFSEESVFGYIFGSSATLSLLPVLTIEQNYKEDNSLFYYIPSSLKKVTITDTKQIPYGAFYNLSHINKVIINEEIESIGECAFYNCKNLEAIYLSNNTKQIGKQAFSQCQDIVIYTQYSSEPTDWHQDWLDNGIIIYWEIDICDFRYQDNMYFVIDKNDEITLTQYVGTQEKAIIPSHIHSLPIRIIKKYAFNTLSSLKELSLPNSIKVLEKYSVFKCNNLIKLELPFIGRTDKDEDNNYLSYTFGASSFTMNNDYIPNSLKEITIIRGDILDNSLAGCEFIEEIEVLDYINLIGKSAFQNCKSLKTIILPKSLKRLNDNTFSGCNSLENINLPSSIIYIGKNAFANCSSLAEIQMPDNITTLNESAFKGCSNLSTVGLPQGLKNINMSAFANCIKLKSINIPSNVERIDNNAFSGCIELLDINIPNKVIYIGVRAFENCKKMLKIIIPNNVITIDNNAFLNCDRLTIYCRTSSKPSGFKEQWHGNRPIVWSYVGE